MLIGKVFGIEVELHPTFVWLISGLALFLLVFDTANLVPSLMMLTFLFVSVFVHELCHSLVAMSKHYKVQRIVLMPIGGVSIADEMPEKPIDEFLVAIAGPMFNFLVVFGILFLVAAVPGLPWPHALFNANVQPEAVEEAMLAFPLFALMWVNLMLGVFNLFIPALPMDGGRVLRAILSAVVGHAKATVWASKISQVFAILMGVLGFFGGNFMLAIIAVFIYLGAGYERDLAVVKATMRGVDYSAAIEKKFIAVDESLPLNKVMEAMMAKNLDLVLVRRDTGLGFLSADRLMALDKEKRFSSLTAGQAAAPVPLFVEGTPAEKLMGWFATKGTPVIGLSRKGTLLGVVTQESLDRLYQLTRLKKKFDLQY